MMNRAQQNWPTEDAIEITDDNAGFSLGDEELVPESCGPFGDYYVTRAKRERSQQLKAALDALNTEPELYRSAAQLLTETLYDDISETVGNYYKLAN